MVSLHALHYSNAKEWEAYQKLANVLHRIPALPIYMENKGLRLDPTLHQSKYLQWPPICPLNWSSPGASVRLPIKGRLFLESRGFVWPPSCGECSGRSLKPAKSRALMTSRRCTSSSVGLAGWWLCVTPTRQAWAWVQERVKDDFGFALGLS